MAGRPTDDGQSQLDFGELARCHQLCLPHTASSRAGLDVLQQMYRALSTDAAAHVLWQPAATAPHHLGAFAAGTSRLRQTETGVRRGLSLRALARLSVVVATLPLHVLARRRWESLIPEGGVGYVLTLGSARAVVPEADSTAGSVILSQLEQRFVTDGCHSVWTDTELDNARAHAFYLRQGYVEVSRDYGQVLLKKQLR
jgi:hypothetical protein